MNADRAILIANIAGVAAVVLVLYFCYFMAQEQAAHLRACQTLGAQALTLNGGAKVCIKPEAVIELPKA
jgi:hypothetical protein